MWLDEQAKKEKLWNEMRGRAHTAEQSKKRSWVKSTDALCVLGGPRTYVLVHMTKWRENFF